MAMRPKSSKNAEKESENYDVMKKITIFAVHFGQWRLKINCFLKDKNVKKCLLFSS